jgi:hypothetical protein
VFDRYSRTARLAPALLAMLPALAVLAAGITSASTALRVAGLLGGSVGLVVVALVRDRGRNVQTRLWRDWGGPPTTRRLRWRDGSATEIARLHDRVERATGLTLPDATEEERDSAEADAHYDEAVEALRARTRDPVRFKLLFEENINYGWRRNSYGLRPVAIVVAVIALIASVCVLVFAGGTLTSRAGRWAPALAISTLVLVWWTFVVTESWVRSAAELYSDKLFEATHTLASGAREQ